MNSPFAPVTASAQNAALTPTVGGTSTADAIDADAIANPDKPGGLSKWADIEKTSSDTDTKGGARVTGYAVIADNSLIYTNGGGNSSVPAGTPVYLQWIDQDGAVSPIYKARTYDGYSDAKDGAYAFAVPTWVDGNLREHKFLPGVAFQPKVRVWMEPYNDPNTGALVTPVRTLTTSPQEFIEYPYHGGAVELQYINNVVVYSYMAPTQKMSRPVSEWVDSSTRTGTAEYTVSGKVWLEQSGSPAGTGPTTIEGDPWATGYKVVWSSLKNDSAVEAAVEAINKLPLKEQPAAYAELFKANPDYVAETVVSEVAADGSYVARFTPGTYNHDYLYGYVVDPQGFIQPAYSSYMAPRYLRPNTYGLVNPPTAAPLMKSWYNVHFAVVNYNAIPTYAPKSVMPQNEAVSLPKFGTSNDAAVFAPIGASYSLGTLPSGITADQISIDASTGEVKFRPTFDQAGKTFDVPVVVTFSNGTTADTKATFTVGGTTAGEVEPAYGPVSQGAGKDAVSGAPTFDDSSTDGVTEKNAAPAGSKFELGPNAPAGASVDPDTGVVTYPVPADAVSGSTISVPVVVTYEDGSTDNATVKITVDSDAATDFLPQTPETTLVPGNGSVSSQAIVFKGDQPDAPTFGVPTGWTAPEGYTVTVDPNTGAVSVTPPASLDANTVEDFTVPVIVSYPNNPGSEADTVNVPFSLDTDNDGIADSKDNDDDNDGYTDVEENEAGTNPKDATSTPNEPAATPAAPDYVPNDVDPLLVVPGKENKTDPISFKGDQPSKPEFTTPEGWNPPAGWDVEVDKSTGVVTVTPPLTLDKDTVEEFNVPVIVSYPDSPESGTDTVNVPVRLDTDGDGNPDTIDDDDDNDGKTDLVEIENGTNPKDSKTGGNGGSSDNGGSAGNGSSGDNGSIKNPGLSSGDNTGSSAARCVPALLGVGLPLLALLPLGLGVQIGLPGVENMMAQFGIKPDQLKSQIAAANTELQKQLGIHSGPAAKMAADIDARLRAIHPGAARIAGGAAIAGISLLAIGLVASQCAPGAGSAANSSTSSR
ncbi:MAG: YPDG domain-containing protein [Corynebacterium sp.]|nr:YPDG domain-containing protein [Corynebacterium sp.]